MSQPAKRVAVSSVNWAKLGERLTAEQAEELNRLKTQNSNYHAEILHQELTDLPKVEWAELKKKMPENTGALDALQKQWEAMKVPYGSVPDPIKKQVDKWVQFNDARIKFHDLKTKHGLKEAEKKEAKWANVPPVEQMTRNHLVKYFPDDYPDMRKHQFYTVLTHKVLKDSNYKWRFSNYRVGPAEHYKLHKE